MRHKHFDFKDSKDIVEYANVLKLTKKVFSNLSFSFSSAISLERATVHSSAVRPVDGRKKHRKPLTVNGNIK